MINSIKGLFLGLSESPILQDPFYGSPVSILFGEHNVYTTDHALPQIVIVPTNGIYLPSTGYNHLANPQVLRSISGVNENIDLYLWAVNPDLPNDPLESANEVESLRARVLQAFGQQRWNGLYWVPLSEVWAPMNSSWNKYGAGLKMTIEAQITVPDVTPITKTIKHINAVIETQDNPLDQITIIIPENQ